MTTNQQLAAEAKAFQLTARKHLNAIRGAGSAVVSLGGSASPELQRALLVAVDGAVVEGFVEP